MVADAVHLTPAQPLGYLGRRRNQDAPSAASLAVFTDRTHDHAVMEHLNLELAFSHGEEGTCCLGSTRYGPYLDASRRTRLA